jgi:hypothetical protein
MEIDPGAEQLIIDQCKRFGHPIPDKIANKPQLLRGLKVYYDAFSELSNDRVNGGIQWQSIANYAMFYGFDEDQTDDLFYHIRAMDLAFSKKVK